MRITVKTLIGEKKEVEVDADETISALKQRLGEKIGIPPEQLNLIYKGAPLLNNATIQTVNIKDGDFIHMILQLHGG
jgi:hypothetical protein